MRSGSLEDTLVIYTRTGEIYTPTFVAATGERRPDIDLHIGLGAHFDPAHDGVSPMDIVWPPEGKPHYIFSFRSHDLAGRETLCCFYSTVDDAPDFDLLSDAEVNRICFEICRSFANEARKRGSKPWGTSDGSGTPRLDVHGPRHR